MSNARVIPIRAWSAQAAPGTTGAQQRRRLYFQIGFFVLFILAPVFDLIRFDLAAGHAVIFGQPWHLGVDDFLAGRSDATQLGVNLLLRLFLPVLGAAALFIAAAWRWGRLYCGWLCPHFSVVETINRLMRHASGKPSVWESKPLPARNPDGSAFAVDARWWLVTVPLVVAFALLWAVVLLTYLIAPAEIYGNLLHLTPTRNQALFIGVGTVVLTLEFLFARHLFCRFGCAVGLFQSLAWMSNRQAMVVGFQRKRADRCAECYRAGSIGAAACEAVCPMRLKPRMTKNQMFACTQCAQCVAACATVQKSSGTLLAWVEEESALQNEAQVSLTGRRG